MAAASAFGATCWSSFNFASLELLKLFAVRFPAQVQLEFVLEQVKTVELAPFEVTLLIKRLPPLYLSWTFEEWSADARRYLVSEGLSICRMSSVLPISRI